MKLFKIAQVGLFAFTLLLGSGYSAWADDTPKADSSKDDAARCKALKGDEKRACRKEMARESCEKLNGAERDRCLGVPATANPDPVAPLGSTRPPT
jgi:hypothetical protein